MERLCDLDFAISPGAFFQTNTSATEKLYKRIAEYAETNNLSTILDVCCGTGSIGLSLAKLLGRKDLYLVGIELSSAAIEDAKQNADLNDISTRKVHFIAAKAEDAISDAIKEGAEADSRAKVEHEYDDDGYFADKQYVAVLDPPRAGVQKSVLQALRSCRGLNRVVYVSCNPTGSFVRDCSILCAAFGGPKGKYKGMPFRLKSATPVDLFPQTAHTEIVALFERHKDDIPGTNNEENAASPLQPDSLTTDT